MPKPWEVEGGRASDGGGRDGTKKFVCVTQFGIVQR